jgi:HTH-type transcriptional regulator/antitoxin HigA
MGKMNHIKLIKSIQEHEQALARLMCLMDADLQPDSKEEDELDVLALLIEKYEQETFPIDPPDPIEAIKFRMEQQGLIKKDLIPYIGSAPKVTEVLNGTRNLSLNMIRKLRDGLGISAEVLIQKPEQQTIIDEEIQWEKFPLSEMRKRGYFEGFSASLSELKEYATEEVGKFLSSVENGLLLKPALLRTSAHLRSNDKEIDSYALWAWQVRVLQKAKEDNLTNSYVKSTVNLAWMIQLAQLSWSDQGPKLAKEFLNRYGIHLIVEQHLPKTYLDGAVCLSEKGNPIVALTLRHDKLDSFWFSLMHELAHIALHVDGSEVWYLDDLDTSGGDEIEQEADALAQKALLPVEEDTLKLISDPVSVEILASKLNVSPCILAGRKRYELDNHRLFGTRFRDKVRSFFEKI